MRIAWVKRCRAGEHGGQARGHDDTSLPPAAIDQRNSATRLPRLPSLAETSTGAMITRVSRSAKLPGRVFRLSENLPCLAAKTARPQPPWLPG